MTKQDQVISIIVRVGVEAGVEVQILNDMIQKIKEIYTPSKTFTPPSLTEIETFIANNNINIDAKAFYTYYTDNGWHVNNKPMKSWKGAVRTWERKNKNQNQKEKMFYNALTRRFEPLI